MNNMKILVTGAKGFIGKHICLALIQKQHTVFEYDLNSTGNELEQYISECDFIVHLAGVNRPKDNEEFNINHSFLAELLGLKKW